MSTATVQQIGQDLAAWLGVVRRGESVSIVDGDERVALLTPPQPSLSNAAPKRSMADWLADQDQRMANTFGHRVVKDSGELMEALRADRQ